MRDLTKKQVNNYLSAIYTLLYLGPVQVRWKKDLKNDSGEICWALYDPGAAENGDDILWISTLNKNYLANSLIHECLHALYQDFSEAKVRRLTKQICKKMSQVQYAHLFIVLGYNLQRYYHFRLI